MPAATPTPTPKFDLLLWPLCSGGPWGCGAPCAERACGATEAGPDAGGPFFPAPLNAVLPPAVLGAPVGFAPVAGFPCAVLLPFGWGTVCAEAAVSPDSMNHQRRHQQRSRLFQAWHRCIPPNRSLSEDSRTSRCVSQLSGSCRRLKQATNDQLRWYDHERMMLHCSYLCCNCSTLILKATHAAHSAPDS